MGRPSEIPPYNNLVLPLRVLSLPPHPTIKDRLHMRTISTENIYAVAKTGTCKHRSRGHQTILAAATLYEVRARAAESETRDSDTSRHPPTHAPSTPAHETMVSLPSDHAIVRQRLIAHRHPRGNPPRGCCSAHEDAGRIYSTMVLSCCPPLDITVSDERFILFGHLLLFALRAFWSRVFSLRFTFVLVPAFCVFICTL